MTRRICGVHSCKLALSAHSALQCLEGNSNAAVVVDVATEVYPTVIEEEDVAAFRRALTLKMGVAVEVAEVEAVVVDLHEAAVARWKWRSFRERLRYAF